MLWAYIDFNRGQSVEDIPVMLSEKYLGENVNGFRCTGAFMENLIGMTCGNISGLMQ